MRKVRNVGGGFTKSMRGGQLTRAWLLGGAVSVAMATVVRPVVAANQAWALAPGSNNFSAVNWTTGSTTAGAANGSISSGDSLYFGASTLTSLNNDEPMDFAPGGITFNAGASGFTIAGTELDLSSSPITDNASNTETISAPILLNGTPTITTATGANLVLSGSLSGSGAFTVAGTGTLTLSGQYVYNPNNPFATAYSGTNTISSGRVVSLNSTSALGQGSTNNIASGATLEIRNTQGSNLNQFSTTFAGAGTLQKTGYGNFIFGGNGGNVNVSMSAGGLIDIESGQLIGSSSGQGQWSANAASMYIAAGASFEGDEAPISIDALNGSGTYLGGYGGSTTTTIGVANGSGTFSGSLKDSRDGGGILSLTKTGNGTEVLTGDNTFSGNTNITGGTLELDNNLALEQSVLNLPAAGTGSVVWGAGVTSTSMYFGGISGSTNFQLSRGGHPTSLTLLGGFASANFSGNLVGGTTLTKAGGGIQTLSGSNTYSGSTTILEGGLSLDYNANASGGGSIIPGTSTLIMGGTTGFVKNTYTQSYPILQVQGSSLGPITQSFNGLRLNAAASSQIAVRGLNGNTATLNLGSITHTAGSSVAFNNLNDGVAGSQGIITTTAVPDSTGILGGWATTTATPVSAGAIQIPTAYATVSGGVVVPYTYSAAQNISDGATTFVGGANTNFQIALTTGNTTTVDTPDGQTTDLNTLYLNTGSSSSNGRFKINIGNTGAGPTNVSTGILRFGVDGGFFSGIIGPTRSTNIGFNTANPGFLTAGGPNPNTPGTLNFQLNNVLNLAASIVDNGTGAVTVVYNIYVNQTSVISTPSTYSGGTFLNSGRMQVLTTSPFGTGPVTVGPMAQIIFSINSTTFTNNFFINGSAGNPGFFFDTPSALRLATGDNFTGTVTLLGDSTIEGGGGTNLFSGQITGNYNLNINGNSAGAGPGNVTLSNPNNNWGGATTLNGGSLVLTSTGVLPTGTDLTILNGGAVTVGTRPVANALSVGALNFSGSIGKLDLNNNDLIVHSSTLAAVNGLVQLGYNGGVAGIISSSVANDTTHLTALGVISNDNGSGTPLYGAGGTIASTFGGATPVDGDVLVKYTYVGDTNLDGRVDGTDYSRIDNGYLNHLTGWGNGDFNYDGVVNGSDYTLIDNAFNTQGSQIAAPTAQIAGSGSVSVPEPVSVGLIGFGALGLLGRRWRR